ncbi:MAG: hypothetical protein FLDDKLPJ_01308 [Phycisphaerae bacterium]|nr:hypothetical protein [Phycisphaerae bacterium]
MGVAGCGDVAQDDAATLADLASLRCMIPDDDPTLQMYRGELGDGEEFHDFQTAVTIIESGCDGASQSSGLGGMWRVGHCAESSIRVITPEYGFSFPTFFYDSASGAFLGYEHFWDGGTCNGWVDAWPDVVECKGFEQDGEIGCESETSDE